MVRTVVDYVRPIRLADAPLLVDTWVCELRAASFTVAYELRTDGGCARPGDHGADPVRLRDRTAAAAHGRRAGAARRRRPTNRRSPTRAASGPRRGARTAYRRPIQVRFSDVDLLGHVNNVRYFDYVHEAQVEVMTGVFQEARISGTVDMVVARSEMDHVGQMNVRPEAYDVWSRVAAVGRTSVTFESEIRDGERVMARSRVVEVNVDEDGHPLPHHPRHLELFEQRIG